MHGGLPYAYCKELEPVDGGNKHKDQVVEMGFPFSYNRTM